MLRRIHLVAGVTFVVVMSLSCGGQPDSPKTATQAAQGPLALALNVSGKGTINGSYTTGSGNIALFGAGCVDPLCTTAVPAGAVVTLTGATANFVGFQRPYCDVNPCYWDDPEWMPPTQYVWSPAPYTFTMFAARAVNAKFGIVAPPPTTARLSLSIVGSGALTAGYAIGPSVTALPPCVVTPCAYDIPLYASVTLTGATANFLGFRRPYCDVNPCYWDDPEWMPPTQYVWSAADYTFTIAAPKTVTAKFLTHGGGTACGDCHVAEATLWASSADLHAAPAADVLLNTDHDTAELLVDECLNCHSMFQRPMGIGAFVAPLDQSGPWVLQSTATAWQATRCEVCHDPSSTQDARLAKFGAILDGPFAPSYTAPSALPQPSQMVFDAGTDTYVETLYVGSSLGLVATKVCNTCHDPADEGGDPNQIVGGHDYGPQGGDSRAFVTPSHAGITCVDCHPTHDFTPVDGDVTTSCATAGCHDVSKAGSLPGVVHVNHLP